MFMRDDPPKSRGRHRMTVEAEMIRNREKVRKHEDLWLGAGDYYKNFERVNTRYQNWTSPRYYEEMGNKLKEADFKKQKEELLKKRQANLKRLLDEDRRTYEVELMVKKTLNTRNPKYNADNVSTEALKEVNDTIKCREKEAQRKIAELKLYQQWRNNNPIVRQLECKYKMKDLKLSWLDQQIEKQMHKEQEEKENLRFTEEQDKKIKLEQENCELIKKQIDEKRQELRRGLEKQMDQLKKRTEESNELRKQEDEQRSLVNTVQELEESIRISQKRLRDKENQLCNIKLHKEYLKKKARVIEEELDLEERILADVKLSEVLERVEDKKQKEEIQKSMREFKECMKDLRECEKQKQMYIDSLYDSELRKAREELNEDWKKEEQLRNRFFKTFMDQVKLQFEKKLDLNKAHQEEILKEREEMLAKIEEYQQDMKGLQAEEEKRNKQWMQVIDVQVKLKDAKKKKEEFSKVEELNEELEKIRIEEEKIKGEIERLDRMNKPVRNYGRRRLF